MNLFSSDSTINPIATATLSNHAGSDHATRVARAAANAGSVLYADYEGERLRSATRRFHYNVSESAIDSIRNRKCSIREDAAEHVHVRIHQVRHCLLGHLSPRGIRFDHEHGSVHR